MSYKAPFKHQETAFENGQHVAAIEPEVYACDEEREVSRAIRAESFDSLVRMLSQPAAVKFFGRTFELHLVALAWVVNPASFGGRSLTEIAREYGVSKQSLSRYTAKASRCYNIRNGGQRAHGGRWKKKMPVNPAVDVRHIDNGHET